MHLMSTTVALKDHGVVSKALIKAGYKAGRSLYGSDLVWQCTSVTFSRWNSLSERIRTMLAEGTAEEVVMLIDDYEFAFTLDGTGIDCSGERITNTSLHDEGYLFLYDPEFGVQALKVDINTAEAYSIVRELS